MDRVTYCESIGGYAKPVSVAHKRSSVLGYRHDTIRPLARGHW
jgi:hypothetical protein